MRLSGQIMMTPQIRPRWTGRNIAVLIFVGAVMVVLAGIFRNGFTVVIGERMSFVSGKTLLLWMLVIIGTVGIAFAARFFRK